MAVLHKWMLTTWVVDYVLFTSTMYGLHTWLAETMTAVQSGLAILIVIGLLNLRDEIWLRVGPPHVVAQVKKDSPWGLRDYGFIAQQLVLFLPLTVFTTYMGLFHWHEEGLFTVARTFCEFVAMSVAKDQISMRFGHKWMHTAAGWKHHKGHHEGAKNLRLLYAYHGMQWIDLLLETFSGPILLFAFNFFVLRRFAICGLPAWIWLVWADHQAHSCNPYSVSFFNPILDWRFLHTVAHHLHHSHPHTHFFFLPYEHFFSSARAEDLRVFNETMNTAIDFRFFLESNDPPASWKPSSSSKNGKAH
eukprot:CAMPEP_0167787408 /NCGR_PEP_ID=MMETSP0111_2-20121227/9405_1 /TAXON_ID=91324 /ORGANISM="Lotharella globosa, Strain CCCM811" /LENGTH=303 /DNA_ID=CAMNT_0007679045 /DNA_START=56 /DNA_END=967 /DNA_ORIENTATION=+